MFVWDAWRSADSVEKVRWLLLVIMIGAWFFAAHNFVVSDRQLKSAQYQFALDNGWVSPCRVPLTYRGEHTCSPLDKRGNMSFVQALNKSQVD